jgi:hypothetical protein
VISWQKASTTEKWAFVSNEAKVLTGLHSQGVSKKVRTLFFNCIRGVRLNPLGIQTTIPAAEDS